jgi:hypothetical protein
MKPVRNSLILYQIVTPDGSIRHGLTPFYYAKKYTFLFTCRVDWKCERAILATTG